MSQNMFNPQGKLLLHHERVCDWINGKNIAPILVEVSPSNICNMNCEYCFYAGEHDKTFLGLDVVRAMLRDMKEMGVKAVNWTGGGEPNLNPKFNDMVAYAHELGLEQGMFTNGSIDVRNPEFFQWIRISVVNDRLYGSFIPKWSKKTMVGVCMTVNKETINSAVRVRKEAEAVGASYFQIRPALMPPGTPALVFDEKVKSDVFAGLKKDAKIPVHITEYKWNDSVKPREYAECYGHNFCPFIDSNGDVVSCAYHLKENGYIFGNLYKKPFREIWKARDPAKIRINDSCQICCKNDQINQMLYFLKHGNVDHRNFI